VSLHIIIDGYNFINASAGLAAVVSRDLEAARSALVAELARYRFARRHQVSVVFDGRRAIGLPPGASRRSRVDGVSVVFSRRGEEADDVIREMARRSGMKAVVVTADTELADSCRRWGAAVVAPEEFEELMLAAEEEAAPESPEEPRATKKGPARRPSRQERRQRLRKKKL
jgi:predicted RNA-binding protein with PIN domain